MQVTFRHCVCALIASACLLGGDAYSQTSAKPGSTKAGASTQKPSPSTAKPPTAAKPAPPATPIAAAAPVVEGLTNADVLQMVSAKLAEDIILNTIEDAPKKAFDLSALGLVALKNGGVSDEIIRVMQGRPRAVNREPAPVTATVPPALSTVAPVETPPTATAAPTEQPKANAVGRLFGGLGRAVGVAGDKNEAAPAATVGGDRVKNLKNGEPAVIRTSAQANVITQRVRDFLESKNFRTEVAGDTVKADWGAPAKCPGITVAQCQERVDVQVRTAADGRTAVSVWVLERRRNRGTNDWGERGAVAERTEKLAIEIQALLAIP